MDYSFSYGGQFQPRGWPFYQPIVIVVQVRAYIFKAIKNATGTSVIFPMNISLIHFVFVLTSAPNVEESFTKT